MIKLKSKITAEDLFYKLFPRSVERLVSTEESGSISWNILLTDFLSEALRKQYFMWEFESLLDGKKA